MTDRIAVVGAGAAGAGVAHALGTTDAEVTVFEKSRGVCGRAATRRREGCRYDHGATHIEADGGRVRTLLTETLDTEGLVAIDRPVWKFDGTGTVLERDDARTRWSYADGITDLAKRLFAESGATVERQTRVAEPVRADGGWQLREGDGRVLGHFDTLVLTPPAPQTADLLGNANWEHALCRTLREAVAVVPFRTTVTVVLHYPFELERPYFGLRSDGDHALDWVSREGCKAGHVPDGESLLVAHGSPDWSVDRFDADEGETAAVAADLVADLLEDGRLSSPDWTDTQFWRYATPEEATVDRDALAAARAHDLHFAGDWVARDGRVDAALRDGLETGERIAE